MKHHNPLVESLLRALISGREITSLYEAYQSEQMHKVAWQMLERIGTAKQIENVLAGSANPRRQQPDAIDQLNEFFNEIELKVARTDHNIILELPLPEGEIAVGLLGEVLLNSNKVVTRRLINCLEPPLMLTLAKLYQIPKSNYSDGQSNGKPGLSSFSFLNRSRTPLCSEFIFSFHANPGCSAGEFADNSSIVILDRVTAQTRRELHRQHKHWVELGAKDGYKRIHTVFTYLDIPSVEFDGDLDTALDEIIPQVFAEIA